MGRQEYQTQAKLNAELTAKDGFNLDEEMVTRTTASATDDHILGQPLPHDRSDRDDDHEHVHRLDTIELVRMGFVGLAVVTSWFQLWNGIALLM